MGKLEELEALRLKLGVSKGTQESAQASTSAEQDGEQVPIAAENGEEKARLEMAKKSPPAKGKTAGEEPEEQLKMTIESSSTPPLPTARGIPALSKPAKNNKSLLPPPPQPPPGPAVSGPPRLPNNHQDQDGKSTTTDRRPDEPADRAGEDESESVVKNEHEYSGLADATLELSASEVELLDDELGIAEKLKKKPPPLDKKRKAKRKVAVAPGKEEAEHDHAPIEIERNWEWERGFFLREAEALAHVQPERAAQMLLEAARASQRLDDRRTEIAGQLKRAADLAPRSLPIINHVRRAMLVFGSAEEALDFSERQVELGGDNETRAAILLEAAAVVRFSLQDGQQAISLLEQALEIHPGYTLALAMKAALHLELRQNHEAALTLEQLAEVINSPAERAACFYRAGTLREMRLGQLEKAEQDYARATEADPENIPVLLALRDLHEQMGKWHLLAAELEQLADLPLDQRSKAQALLRAGALHIDCTGDGESAARVLIKAAKAEPENPAPLSRLAQVYESSGRFEQLIETLRQLLPLTYDVTGKAVLLTHVGWLLQTYLGRDEDAIDAYRQAISSQPEYLPAVQALGTLYRQRGRFIDLVSILHPEIEGTGAAERRAVRCLEIAEIYNLRLKRDKDAAAMYQRAIELSPGISLAFWRLCDLLRREQAAAALAELISAQLPAATDHKTRYHLLLELAHHWSATLGSPEQAIQVLTEARQVKRMGHDSRSATIALLRLYQETGRYVELVELLLEEAKETKDAKEAQARRLQAATILEEHLQEPGRAIEIYQEMLELDGRNVAATRALGQTYHRLGAWPELIRLYHHEIEVEPDRPEVVDLWCRIGRIYHEALGERSEAISAYKEALQRKADCTMALEALEILLRAERRFEELVQLLEQYAATRKDFFAAANALCRAAELADTQLKRPGRAIQLYQQAWAQSPTFLSSAFSLLALQLRQRQFDQAAALLSQLITSTTDAVGRACLQLQLARIKQYRLEETPDIALWREIIQEPVIGGRLRIELIQAVRLVDPAQWSDVLLETSAQIMDASLAAAFLLEGAYLLERTAGPGAQLTVAGQAFGRLAEDQAVFWCLERAMQARQQWSELACLFVEEAAQSADPPLRLLLLTEVMDAQLMALEISEAAQAAQECLAIDPRHLPALRLLAWKSTEEQDWEQLAYCQDRVAEACQDKENRLQAALLASDLWSQRVGDPAQALTSLKLVLADEPGQAEVFARAEHLLRLVEDYQQLSQLYTRRIKVCPADQQKVGLLHAHALLLRDKLADREGAIAQISELLSLDPGHLVALSDLAALHCQQQRWSDAVSTLSRLAKLETDRARRKRAQLQEAQIWLDWLHDPSRSREVLKNLLEEEPGEAEAKQLLIQVTIADGQWGEARRLLEEIAAEDQPWLQVWAMSQLAEVARIGLRDEELRQRCENEALTLAASDRDLLHEVMEHFRRQGELPRFIAIGTSVLHETNRTEISNTLRLAIARVLLEDLNQPHKTLEYLRETLAQDPENEQANLLLAMVFERQGDIEESVVEYRRILHRQASSVEAYRGLSRLMSVLGHPVLAGSGAAIVDFLGAATPREMSQVEQLERRTNPPGYLDVQRLASTRELQSLRHVLELVVPYLGAVFPLELRNPLRPTHNVTVAAKQLAAALGLSGVKVSIEGDMPARSGPGELVPLLINAQIANQPQSALFRYWVGRALASAATSQVLLEQLSNAALKELVEAFLDQHPVDPALQQYRKQLLRSVPRKVRKQLELMEMPRFDQERWEQLRSEEQWRVDLLGLLLCGNPKVSLQEYARAAHLEEDPVSSTRIQELMRFSVSDDYEMYYHALWNDHRPV